MKTIILVGALMLAGMAHATDIYIGVYTVHMGGDPAVKQDGEGVTEWNTDNRLYGINYQGWEVFTFKNSYNRRSWGAGYNWRYEVGHMGVGLHLGGATGYQADDFTGWFKPLNVDGVDITAQMMVTVNYVYDEHIAFEFGYNGVAIPVTMRVSF